MYHMNQVDGSNLDPQVNNEIEKFHVPQFVVDFGSQVNILPKSTWIKLGQPQLIKYYFYLKLVN